MTAAQVSNLLQRKPAYPLFHPFTSERWMDDATQMLLILFAENEILRRANENLKGPPNRAEEALRVLRREYFTAGAEMSAREAVTLIDGILKHG